MSYALLDVRLKATHCKPMVVLLSIYGIVNCIVTKMRGKPVYSFLTWENELSILIVAGLEVLFVVIYLMLVKLSFALKPPRKNHKN